MFVFFMAYIQLSLLGCNSYVFADTDILDILTDGFIQ